MRATHDDWDVDTDIEENSSSAQNLAELNQMLAPLIDEFTAATQTRSRKRKRSASPLNKQLKSQKTAQVAESPPDYDTRG
ncbi:hypothetical protein BDV93DRAFT_112573 [Ceratobasidium sp. AG-I]|nr:hypothetical protein BDV93DRAFT_112573 [Ceratobasidium sp. AG-I]